MQSPLDHRAERARGWFARQLTEHQRPEWHAFGAHSDARSFDTRSFDTRTFSPDRERYSVDEDR